MTRLVVERALAANPAIDFVVRTHSDTEAAHLRAVTSRIQAVHGERELAVQMVRYGLRRFGVDSREAEAIAQGLRRQATTVRDDVGRRRRRREARSGAGSTGSADAAAVGRRARSANPRAPESGAGSGSGPASAWPNPCRRA